MSNPSNPSIAQTFKAGDKLAGCYTLKEILPEQGFCFIWLAHDEELNKDIVLHFVPDSVAADARAMSELKQEAKRNRQLIHPRIVRVHDLVEDEKWAAISMDHIPGETLASLQKKREKNAFNPSEIAAGISELCQTIEDAHRIDLFHRDLTPENLLATGNGVMVQKFGISRVILDSLCRGERHIEDSRDIAYISPQQLDGERPSSADDIYSLGASIFDLLTGTPPFIEGEVIPQIRKTVPPLASERRAAREITAEPMPKAWDDTIAACLAKNAEERPKSAAEAGSRFAAAKPGSTGSAPAPAAVAPATEAAAAAGVAAAAESESAPGAPSAPEEPASKQKRPWSAGPGKVPIIAEATVLSKTDVPKGEAKAEGTTESDPTGKPAEPATAVAPKKGGPTTPTGFPLRAFVEVEGTKPKNKSSAGLVAGAVVVLLILIVGYLVAKNNSGSAPAPETAATTGTNSAAADTSESNTPPTPVAAGPTSTPAASPAAQPVNLAANTAPSPSASPAPSAVAQSTAAPPAVAESPAATYAASSIPASALAGMSEAQVSQLVTDKSKAVDQAKAALADAEKAAQEKAAAQSQAAAAVKQLQTEAKQKADAAAAAKKTADAAAATLKQQQDSLQKAQSDADAAQKIAAAKAQAADQLRKTVQDAQAAAQQQQASVQQAEADAAQLSKTIADRQKAADDAAKAAADAQKASQAQAQALSQAQADLGQVQAGLEQARNAEKARQAADEAAKLQKEREAEAARLTAQAAAAAKAADDAQKALDAAKKAVADAEKAQAAAEAQAEAARKGAIQAASPAPGSSPAASPSPSPAATPAHNAAPPTLSVRAPNPHLKVDQALSNSLGMRFAPVGNILFSTWLTRVEDFAAFVKATGYKGTAWQDPGFKQAPDHPVVNVSWNDANQFCLWLTQKEHREGLLSANQEYRLPTDLEWSAAVSLPPESGRTPESRDMDIPDVYPWGTQWPPPPGAGNYTGEETDSDVAIKGYNDGFAWTSPVGSFNANKYGLYDMGGNVWEWCGDWWNAEQKSKVLRGGSWYNGALKLSLLSSCRIHASADQGTDNYGFRIVIAPETGRKHYTQQ